MKTLNHIILTIIFSVSILNISAQSRTIQGTINGIDGKMAGAIVSDLNSKLKTVSDANGNFAIELTNADTHLEFKYKRMKTNMLVSENDKQLDVYLIPTDKKLFKIVAEREDMSLCDLYLKEYSEGEFTFEVKALKEKLFFIEAYNIAASQFTDTALRNYLKLYPNGSFTQKAEDAIEIAAWQKARYNNTSESYNRYLNQYPNGKAAGMAKEKLAELQ
jgi:hypothetical protein